MLIIVIIFSLPFYSSCDCNSGGFDVTGPEIEFQLPFVSKARMLGYNDLNKL